METAASQPSELTGTTKFGITEPRLFTKPLRELTPETSRGFECADFMEKFGTPFKPWQKEAAIRGLELNEDGKYRFRIVLVLVARQNGKSHLKRGLTTWRMFMDGPVTVGGFAQDVSLAREQWNYVQEMIHDCPDLDDEWGKARNVNGDEQFRLKNNSRYLIGASNGKAMRGRSFDELNIDELREQHDWKGWAALSKTTSARPNSQIWLMSNAGDDESVVLNRLRDVALGGQDDSICILEWSGEDDCDIDDWDQIRQANPGLGYTVSEAAIRSALNTDPPAIFRTEVLCQRVDALDSAIDLGAWKDCTDPSGSLESMKDRVCASFDVAPDGTHCALVAAAKLSDGRVRVEVVDAWQTTEDARRELPDLLKRVDPVAFAWFPSGPAGALAPVIRALQPDATELTGQGVAEACMGFADLVRSRLIVHGGEALLNAQVTGAKKLPSADGWRFTRKGPAGHVDSVYAAAGAAKTALEAPERKKAVFRSFNF